MSQEEKILKAYATKVFFEARSNALLVLDKEQVEKYYKFLLALYLSGQFTLPSLESVQNFIEE